MVAVEVGQEVMVQTSGVRSKAIQRDTVIRVGRVWVDIDVPNLYRPSVHRMRMRDQTDGGDTPYCARFYTIEQWETLQRRNAAVTSLDHQGISLSLLSPWRGREHELTEIINRGMGEAGTGERADPA